MSTIVRWKRDQFQIPREWHFQRAEDVPTDQGFSADPKTCPKWTPPVFPPKAKPAPEPVKAAEPAAEQAPAEPAAEELPQFLTKKPGRKSKAA